MSQAIPSNFWQWMANNRNGPEVLMILVFIAAVALVLIVSIVSIAVYKVHRNRLNDALKRELIERGASAEDIAAIVRATPTKGRSDRHAD
jgi:hypothetical protein